IPSLESLNLPASLAKLADKRQGLVLVTGPTGCGKTSTLAALIDLVNTRRAAHVVTIEDPVEYQHANRSAIVEQIEVGRDTPDFAVTLRSIMRQTPDVILVGEMRDAETMATALTAAETGHLVLSTLHTNDAIQAVSRILDSFPASNQPQIRQQFSLALAAVIAQQLVPGIDGVSRWPATEMRIDIESGGRRLIRIVDDGSGMLRDDALLAFERHATSKLRDVKDLLSIATLGFRGEALPSIASVSRLLLETRSQEETTGTRIEIAGGKMLRCEEAALGGGTCITVRDLFYNVPARKKFLRTEQTELAHIASLVT